MAVEPPVTLVEQIVIDVPGRREPVPVRIDEIVFGDFVEGYAGDVGSAASTDGGT